MLYTLLASCLMSHLNNTPKPDSVQEPDFKIFRGCLLVRQPLLLLRDFVSWWQHCTMSKQQKERRSATGAFSYLVRWKQHTSSRADSRTVVRLPDDLRIERKSNSCIRTTIAKVHVSGSNVKRQYCIFIWRNVIDVSLRVRRMPFQPVKYGHKCHCRRAVYRV